MFHAFPIPTRFIVRCGLLNFERLTIANEPRAAILAAARRLQAVVRRAATDQPVPA